MTFVMSTVMKTCLLSQGVSSFKIHAEKKSMIFFLHGIYLPAGNVCMIGRDQFGVNM